MSCSADLYEEWALQPDASPHTAQQDALYANWHGAAPSDNLQQEVADTVCEVDDIQPAGDILAHCSSISICESI